MKVAPLNKTLRIPVSGPGSFGFNRKHDIHTGVDLYCNPGEKVYPIEDGKVIAIIDFTGTKADSPWWNDTRAILIEGESGVFVYGELTETVNVGDVVSTGTSIGEVKTVLLKDKGLPMTMLHLELYKKGTTDVVWWKLGEAKPESLLDPTVILKEIKNSIDNAQASIEVCNEKIYAEPYNGLWKEMKKSWMSRLKTLLNNN